MPIEQYVAVAYAFLNPATSGDNSLVAAVSGRRIRLLSYVISNQVGTANSVKFRSAANEKSSLKVLTGNQVIAYNGGVFAPILETNIGEALQINLSAATGIGCDIAYQVL